MREDYLKADGSGLNAQEKEIEKALRPLNFGDFTGQKKVVDNIRIFVESRSGVREVGLKEARSLSSGGASGSSSGLTDTSVRYLKAALAIIEIDLNRSLGTGSK